MAAIRIYQLLRTISRRAAMASSRSGDFPITIGDVEPRETADSGELQVGDVQFRRLQFKGQYAALEALVSTLKRGDVVEDYFNMGVETATLRRLSGGVGLLDIRLVPEDAFAESETPLRTTWEIDMTQVARPILSHPALADGDDGDTMADHLARWWDGESDQRRQFEYADDAGATIALTETEIKWARKMLRGTESYLAFAPVVIRTSVYEGRPEVGGTGKIKTPEVYITGYEYLKSGDKSQQRDDRTWMRTETWMGADTWDRDIYEEDEG